MRTFLILLIAVVIIGGGWYWYSMQSSATVDDVNMNIDVTPTPITNTNTIPPANIGTSTATSTPSTTGTTKEFTVTNSGMTFTTKTLSVKKGDTVKITFKNSGGTHDLRIDGYNAGTKVIQAGQEETFTFVADKAGSFEYFCSIGQHRANGMVGTLTVTP